MAEKSGFFDSVYDAETEDYDLKYLAEEFAAYFSLFIGNGVFISPTNQLKVHAGEGLTVTVEPGWAFIDGYWYHNEEQKTLTVPPNTTAQIRTDCVKCRLDYANRRIQTMYFNETTDVDRGGNYYDLKLAEVIVPATSVQILESNVTDTRTNEDVCGFVKSLMETVPTDDLFSQYDAIFENWFDKVKGKLTEDPATALQTQIGFLEDLETEVKTDLVSAMNWLLNNMSIETDSTLSVEGAAADAKATGDAITELRELFNSINMQYLNSTEIDTVQLKDAEGVWHNWKSGGLGRVYFYNEGYIDTALVGNLVQGGNTSDSLTDKAPVFNPITISLPTTSSSECTVRTKSTVDVTNYKELGLCIVEGLVKKEFTLDISEVSGSYYLGVKQSYSENGISSILSVSNNTTFLSTHLQASTNFRYRETPTDENKTCIISQMWLK